MSKVIAIAQREIQERAFVFAVAAAVAAAPFLSLLVRDSRFNERLELARVIGVVAAVAFVLGLAVMLGVSIVGRESREKRLSFYFARPVAGSAIWYGKIIGAVVLMAGCAAIMFVPTIGLTQSGWSSFWQLPLLSFIGVALGGAFVLMLLMHAASTMLRSRSLLILGDFLAAVAVVGITMYLLARVAIHQAFALVTVMAAALLVVVTLTFFFGGAWQLSRGRIDPKRAHRQLSLFTWSSLAIAMIVLAAVTAWIGSVGISDLTRRYAGQTRDGGALIVGGEGKHRLDYQARFLTDVNSGRTIPAGLFADWLLATSADGRKAIWPDSDSMTILQVPLREARLTTLHLRLMRATIGQDSAPTDTGIDIVGRPDALELSQDGSRAAVLSGGTVTVWDIARRRSLGSARIQAQSAFDARLQFITPDDVRIYVREGGRNSSSHLVAYEFAPAHHSLRTLLDVSLPVSWVQYEPSADGSRLLIRANHGGKTGEPPLISVMVYDLKSGKQLFENTATQGSQSLGAWLFADGRVATLVRNEDLLTLHVIAADGSPLRVIDLGKVRRARIETEIDPGVLAIASTAFSLRRGGHEEEQWIVRRVDTSSGSVQQLTEGLRPVPQRYGVGATPAVPRSARVYADAMAEHYYVVDLHSGARRKLL